jgi:phospholipase C
MSSCVVTGFFDITMRHCIRQARFGVAQPQAVLYGHYRSTISGTMESLGFVYIRPPTPAWNEDVPDHAVVFVIGTLFARTGNHPSLIEATHMDVVNASATCRRCRIAFPPCYVDAVGVVASDHYYLSPAFLAVPITVSHYVWDGVRTFGLTCVFSSSRSSFVS